MGTDAGPPEEWREAVLTNVLGSALTARAALPALVRAGGHLVLSGSVAGRGGLVDTEPGMLTEERRNDPGLEPSDVTRAVLFAVGEPRHVDISEIVIRPVGASPYR